MTGLVIGAACLAIGFLVGLFARYGATWASVAVAMEEDRAEERLAYERECRRLRALIEELSALAMPRSGDVLDAELRSEWRDR